MGANGGVFTWAQLQPPLSRRLGAAPSSRVANTLAVRYAALSLCHQPQVVRCVLVLHRTPAPLPGGHPTNKASRLCMWFFSHSVFFLVFSACVSFSLTHFLSALLSISPVPLCLSLMVAAKPVVSLGVGCDDDSRGLVVSHVETLAQKSD